TPARRGGSVDGCATGAADPLDRSGAEDREGDRCRVDAGEGRADDRGARGAAPAHSPHAHLGSARLRSSGRERGPERARRARGAASRCASHARLRRGSRALKARRTPRGACGHAGTLTIVACMRATTLQVLPEKAWTSPVHTVRVRPALWTRPMARKRSPIAGRRRLILNSALTISHSGGAFVSAA